MLICIIALVLWSRLFIYSLLATQGNAAGFKQVVKKIENPLVGVYTHTLEKTWSSTCQLQSSTQEPQLFLKKKKYIKSG